MAVLASVSNGQPRVLTTHGGKGLPAGPFEAGHRSLQTSLRAWVEQQTHHPLGYVEQLYTFADRDRTDGGQHMISISYLGLAREAVDRSEGQAVWRDWYDYFPWEDWRHGAPALITQQIAPALASWAEAQDDAGQRARRHQRAQICFGLGAIAWNEELVLQRYELLFEAGLVAEARRQGRCVAQVLPGESMHHDHRRILATAMARLRAKIKYRPVVFELMPPEFTLLQLQQAVQALAGRGLHKQNFRRLMEQQDLVEETGQLTAGAAGRPAKLFRFRRDVLLERAMAGSKLPLVRQSP